MPSSVNLRDAKSLQDILDVLESSDKSRLAPVSQDPQVAELDCNESFMSDVLLPLSSDLEDRLPEPTSLPGRVIERLFGINQFLNSAQEDFCNGRLRSSTAFSASKLIGKLSVGVLSGQIAFGLGAGGLVLAGPGGLAAGLAVGGGVLVAGSWLVDKALDGVRSVFNRAMDLTGDYVHANRTQGSR